MRVFLGNPPWSKPGFYGVRAGSRWPHFESVHDKYMPFPFYLSYATAILEREGFECRLVDGIAEGISDDQFAQRMGEFRAPIAVFESSMPSLKVDLANARRAKELGAEVVAFAGINSQMYEPEFLEKYPEVDFVFQGEYELTLLELVQKYFDNKDYASIKGLVWRDEEGKGHKNERREVVKDLESFPWPARHHLPMANYHDCPGAIPSPSLQMWASRGCPYQCVFCAWPQIMYDGRDYRTRDVTDLIDEVEYCVKTYGMQSVYFDDDTFNIGKRRMMAIAEEKIRRLPNIPWAAMSRADTSDEETLKALKSSGLVAIKYGIESGNQEVVDATKKNLDLGKAERMIGVTRKLGIKMHLTFSIGLPGETKDSIKETIRFAKKLNPHSLQFSISTPFPGSSYYEMAVKEGWLASENTEDYNGSTCAVVRTANLSEQDLEYWLKEAYRQWEIHKLFRAFREPQYIKKALLHPMVGLKRLKRAFVSQA